MSTPYLGLCDFLINKLFVLAVSKDLSAEEESALFRMLQAVAVPLIGNACHVFMNGLNRVQVRHLRSLFHKLQSYLHLSSQFVLCLPF